jgi:hypothetical protein
VDVWALLYGKTAVLMFRLHGSPLERLLESFWMTRNHWLRYVPDYWLRSFTNW